MKIRFGQQNDFMILTQLWEASVRATHHFLEESDIEELRPKIFNNYLSKVTLLIAEDSQKSIAGFIGISGNKIEMLFVAPQKFGQGTGRKLVEYVVTKMKVHLVDVNEQNNKATEFYQYMGFEIFSRSELDGEGRPFPILHMRLASNKSFHRTPPCGRRR